MRGRAEGIQVLAYVEGEPSELARDLMRRAVDDMARREGWSLGRPQYVDEGDDGDWTIGALLYIPPASTTLAERGALEDVEAFVAALERVSDPGQDFAIEMNGEVVGFVEQGRRDALLQRGLFEPWRERLESPPGP